jgi:hypothetical protein
MTNIAIGSLSLGNCNITANYNTAIGFNSLHVGHNVALGNNASRCYTILSCKTVKNKHSIKYTNNNHKYISLLVYDGNHINHHVEKLPLEYWGILENPYKVYKPLIHKWLTLYLSFNVYLGEVNKDIFKNIATYYIDFYYN